MESFDTQVGGRASQLSVSVEGDALLLEAADSVATMRRLVPHAERLGSEALESFRATLARVEERIRRRDLYVAVAGVAGSGKGTFLDALIGERRLGQARGRAGMVTFLRYGATPRYQARLVDGTMEDFARLVPDRSREHDQRVGEAEAAFSEAQREHAELDARAKTAAVAYALAKDELRRVAGSAESALEAEQSVLSGFASAQQGEGQAQKELTVAESAIPKRLRAPLSKMGFWLRLWRALFVLFFKHAWRTLEVARAALVAARERAEAMRERAASAAEDRQRTQELVREPEALAEARRMESGDARRVADRAQVDLERARLAMEQRRTELSRYVEDRLARFFDGIRRLCDEGDRAKDVIELSISYPAELIPEDAVLIDLPNLKDETRKKRTWTLLQEAADGCLLTWDLERRVDASNIEFVRAMKKIVPHILLVQTKVDATFLDAVRSGREEPWESVDEARKSATQRFAQEIGRDPGSVLSVAVAAKAALEDPDSGLAARFRREVAKLFELLRHERALLLGARAAKLLGRCIPEARAAEEAATRAYKAHIAELEAQRMPEPEAFHRRALGEAEPLIEKAGLAAVEDVSTHVREGYRALRGSLVLAGGSESASRTALVELERSLATGAENLRARARMALAKKAESALQTLESRLFLELGKRYRIPDVKTLRTDPPTMSLDDLGASALSTPRVPDLVASFRRARVLLGTFGVALGATVGWFSAPLVSGMIGRGIPSAMGAALAGLLGGALAFTRMWGGVRSAALGALESSLGADEEATLESIAAHAPDLADAVRSALDASLELVIIRHGRDMTEPTEARERALHDERANLGELQEIAETLEDHARTLELLRDAAIELSAGLCR